MTGGDEKVTKPRPARPSTLRVRRRRVRLRERLRLLTLEIPVSAVDAAIARGFIKHEDSNLAWSVIDSVYRTQLSDTALDWLTDNAVITTEAPMWLRSSAASAIGWSRRQHDRT